ncbi:MAG TPA: 2-oxoacid:acceptor oxidoreductase subunit alpha [Terriglobia bacterium]|nr:2-oxoacid:acceptor oxidoreductase subunit alpha [Terriglobia bacterium]
MATTDLAIADRDVERQESRIANNLSIQVATVNGSGSQSANMILLRAIFQMGIPVSGKNLFPSNIAGLPTWFTIRASREGYIARRKEVDFLVAMNPETAEDDLRALAPGAAVVYDEKMGLNRLRDDLVFYPVPFDKLVAPICPDAKLRKLVRNMIYDGVVANLLGIEMAEVEKALRKQFKKKVKAAELNWKAAQVGYDYAAQNLSKSDRFALERMDKTKGKVLIEGNAAAALGCLFAGVTVVCWYPITPSSSLCETLINYMRRFRMDPETGKATFAIVQAEDEMAALGMTLGAGWAGARAMTSTSGPGISLMAEFTGLGYYAEIPAVIFDVQRVGPSTGLPTRTQQGDVLSTAVLSHGDSKHPLLLPATTEECYTMAMDAFDLAEGLQTPVFVMSDLDLAMNYWMSDPFKYPEKPIARGKVLSAEDVSRMGGFARYKDVDGDGVPYRTIPGTNHPLAAYFTRGSGHNEKAIYTEKPDVYVNNMDRLNRKLETARAMLPPPVIEEKPGADIGILAYGTTHWAILEARDQLEQEHDLQVSYCRARAFPFSQEVKDFIRRHPRVYVVEQNRDGQVYSLLRMEVEAEDAPRLRSIRHYNGLPIDAHSVTDAIVSQEAKS